MSDRKLVVYAEIPLPADMAEAGRIQISWAEQVKKFNAGLADGVGRLELRVASSRPRTAKTKETEPKGPPLPAPVGQQEPEPQIQDRPVPDAASSVKTPIWAQR